MAHSKTKFQKRWLNEKDGNGHELNVWCVETKDPFIARCKWCDKFVRCDGQGCKQLIQHASGAKHKQKLGLLVDKRQSLLAPVRPKDSISLQPTHVSASGLASFDVHDEKKVSIQLVTNDDLKTKAEILWALKVCDSNFSFSSCDNLDELFQAMFPDSAVARSFKMGSSKVSYLISQGMGPFFIRQVIKDINDAPNTMFTLHFDETTTIQGNKQLDILIRYFSNTSKKVEVRYLKSVMLGHAFADTVFNEIQSALLDCTLPLTQLLSVSSDGPNVNKAIKRKIDTAVREATSTGKGLVDIGFCTIHTAHNAFRSAIQKYGLECEELAIDLYYFFKISACRREDFDKVQVELNLDETCFIRYVQSRWLTLLDALGKIRDKLDALKKYFLEVIPSTKGTVMSTARYKRICEKLGSQNLMVQLHFLLCVKPLFDKYLLLFQTEGPLVHCLYPSMCDLIKSVLFRFQNQRYVKENAKKLKSIDVSRNHLPYEEIEIGSAAREALQKIASISSRSEVMKQILTFYETASMYLIENLPLENNLLRSLRILNPKEQENKKGCRYIRTIAEAMSFLSDDDIVNVIDEWKLYSEERLKPAAIQEVRIDEVWSQILEQKSASGRNKYPNLSLVVKAALSLAHSNADSERGLSINKRLLGSDRSRLSPDSVNGIRASKDAIRSFDGITHVPITKYLMSAARASSRLYQQKLDEEKKKAEKRKQEENERKEKELQREREQLQLNEKLKNLKSKVTAITQDEEKINSETSRANMLLKEAQNRLDDSISKKDMDGISIASDLLRLAKEKIESSTENQRNIQKRKRELIASYESMSKKQKK